MRSRLGPSGWSGSHAQTRRSRCRTRRTVRAGLARAEFVVLQECYANTETAAFADLQLPASTWGEKEGTVTNSERRISRVRAAIAPPGEARADWEIAVAFAQRLDARLRPGSQRCSPIRRLRPSSPSTRRRRVAAISTSPACRMHASMPLARSSGRVVKATPKAEPACTPTIGSRPSMAARDSPRSPTSRWLNASMRAFRFASTPDGCATNGTA